MENRPKVGLSPSKTPSTLFQAPRNRQLCTTFHPCDSPFRNLSNFSTPPSRVTKIKNPFEKYLTERLHTSVFSPNVFVHESTPKSSAEDTFRWSIDHMSSMHPAEIDETVDQQQLSDHDPTVESILQEKINMFFSDKVIVPSPMHDNLIRNEPLVVASPSLKSQAIDGCTQTLLTLPPILPVELEKALQPYFNYCEQNVHNQKDELYDRLFEESAIDAIEPDVDVDEERTNTSRQSSLPLSTGSSPIDFSPDAVPQLRTSLTNHVADLDICNISPVIMRTVETDYQDMSIDGSMHINTSKYHECYRCEYENVFHATPPNLKGSVAFRPSNVFTRKRLSDSFRNCDVLMETNEENSISQCVPLISHQSDEDTGYHTHVFSSTPTKSTQVTLS